MTINLFGVDKALDAEDKKYFRSKQVREKTLKRRGKVEDVIEGANNAQQSDSQEEAQKSSSPD